MSPVAGAVATVTVPPGDTVWSAFSTAVKAEPSARSVSTPPDEVWTTRRSLSAKTLKAKLKATVAPLPA